MRATTTHTLRSATRPAGSQAAAGTHSPPTRSRQELDAAGRALRQQVPRSSHSTWKPPAKGGRDPVATLLAATQGLVPELVPIRFGRMLQSPFTFFRGSAVVMAADLAATPATGIRVQACGDCHLLNFGGYATPERRVVFDINDFDETLPAPWEWDVKRLAASFAIAARDKSLAKAQVRAAAAEVVRSYRRAMAEYAAMPVHPARRRSSPATSARRGRSTPPSPTSRSPTPTRPSATMPPWWRPCGRGGSRPTSSAERRSPWT